MKSLRTRLIAWYMSVGAFIVLIVGLLAAIAMIEGASFEARQAMAAAARAVPGVVQEYRAQHKDMRDINVYFHDRFRPLGVVVHARILPQVAKGMAWFGPPSGIPPERIAKFLSKPPSDTSMYERLLAMQIKPITASFSGGDAFIFVDPRSLQGLFKRLGVFMLVLAVVVLGAAWRIAVVVAQHTLEPLLRTTEALDRFGSGQFTLVDVRDDDRSELGDLARAYNRAVAQITRALDERAKAEAEMRQFVADAGHQLRTPLTVIMGYVSGMAQRAQFAHESRRYDAMLAQTRRMKDLIDRLITLARLEHTSAKNEEGVDLHEIGLRVRATFAESAQERIVVHAPAEAAYAKADESDVTEALCALVDNALKYAPSGNVEVRISRGHDEWLITVADRGPGMTEDELRNAFDRFYRGSASEETSGTGLGLAIARKSIERAGGSIRLQNRVNGGLSVIVSLRPFQASAVTLSA
jgi:signal transduction histidine kinase